MPPLDVPPAVELPHLAAEFRQPTGAQTAPPFTVVRKRCPDEIPGDIVVCAIDPKRYRLPPLPFAAPEALPQARLQLSGSVSIDVHVESAMLGGARSNRAMVGMKIKF